MIPAIIGIAGKARTGKNTLAAFIQAQYGGTYPYAFAEPMRAMLKVGFGIDFDTEYWNTHKEREIPVLGKSPRQLLQKLGTEWGRELINPDVWLILAQGALHNRGAGMVVTDVRFENEAQWVRKNRGTIIHLERKAAPSINPHKSEAGLQRQPEDITVYNDMDLESLQHAVSKLW